MDITQSDSRNESGQNKLGRRKSLKSALALGAASLLSRIPVYGQSQQRDSGAKESSSASIGRRKLGSLEVSSIGLGCLPLVGYYAVKLDKNVAIASSARPRFATVTIMPRG